MDKKILTIIPARGGSQGVPKKNIRPLAGKPLLAWTIAAAQEAKLAGRIIVSTDSEEIAEVARRYGAEVPFLRPAEIAQNLSTDQEFVMHALGELKKEGYEPDVVARFSPTTPLRPARVIDEAIAKLLESSDCDSVRPISKLSHHPYKAWRIEGEFLVPAFPESVTGHKEPHNMPRQLFPEMYAHLGASGVAWTRTHTELGTTSGNTLRYILMDETDALDINTPFDFEMAEFLMRKRLGNA